VQVIASLNGFKFEHYAKDNLRQQNKSKAKTNIALHKVPGEREPYPTANEQMTPKNNEKKTVN